MNIDDLVRENSALRVKVAELEGARSENKNLIKAIQQEHKRLAQNQQVPIDLLRILVFVTYACGEISIGKASELLCLDLLEFRKQWNEWIEQNPRMKKIFEEYYLLPDELEEDIKNA